MKQRKEKQLKFVGVGGWGGRRSGSGRPNLSGQVNHMKRPKITLKTPLHITLRLKERLPSIRKKDLLKEFKRSVNKARRLKLYVIHFSLQRNHIHLFCESENNKTVGLGMRALAGRFAKQVRAYAATKASAVPKGSIFNGRYHLHVLKTPREVKNALEYVLLNLSKHQNLIEYLDPFSSGSCFRQWAELLGSRFRNLIRADAEFYESQGTSDLISVLSPPRSWLSQTGWLRACG